MSVHCPDAHDVLVGEVSFQFQIRYCTPISDLQPYYNTYVSVRAQK